MTKNNVTKKEENAVANAAAFDYSAYAGKGFESHTREDYSVPFLGVLQSNSPLIETNAEARQGMLVNTVTQELFDGKKGINFVPVDTQHVVVEWRPREQGGGFVAVHELDSEIVKKAKNEQEFGKYKTIKGDPKSNDLIETFYVYGLFVSESGSTEQMIIPFTSTKIKVYKRWMTKARTIQVPLPDGRRINPPLFAHKYRVTSISEKNTKGSFHNFNIEFAGTTAEEARLAVNSPLFQEAVAFFDVIRSGDIKVAHESQETAGSENTEEAEIPFV